MATIHDIATQLDRLCPSQVDTTPTLNGRQEAGHGGDDQDGRLSIGWYCDGGSSGEWLFDVPAYAVDVLHDRLAAMADGALDNGGLDRVFAAAIDDAATARTLADAIVSSTQVRCHNGQCAYGPWMDMSDDDVPSHVRAEVADHIAETTETTGMVLVGSAHWAFRRRHRITIYRNGAWAGDGIIDEDGCIACSAVLGPDYNSSDECYEAIQDAIDAAPQDDGRYTSEGEVERPDGIYSWAIG